MGLDAAPTGSTTKTLDDVISAVKEAEILTRRSLFEKTMGDDEFNLLRSMVARCETQIAQFRVEQSHFSDVALPDEIEIYKGYIEQLRGARERLQKMREGYKFKNEGTYPLQEGRDRFDIQLDRLIYQTLHTINYWVKGALSYLWTMSDMDARKKGQLSAELEKMQKDVKLEMDAIKHLRKNDQWRSENPDQAADRERQIRDSMEDRDYRSYDADTYRGFDGP